MIGTFLFVRGLIFLPIERILERERTVQSFNFVGAFSAKPLQDNFIDVGGSGGQIRHHRHLHGEFEQHTILFVIAFRYDPFQSRNDDVRKIIGILFVSDMARVKTNCFFDELAL